MRQPLLLVATVVFALLVSPSAHACKCISPSLSSAFAKADAVLWGEITAVEGDKVLGATLVVAVKGRWKGDVAVDTTVRLVTGNSSCGLTFAGAKVGKRWLFTATERDGVLHVRQCDGSRPATAKVRLA